MLAPSPASRHPYYSFTNTVCPCVMGTYMCSQSSKVGTQVWLQPEQGPTGKIMVTDLVETRLPVCVCVCDLSVSGLNFLRTFDPVTLHRSLLSSSLIIFAYDIQLCVLYLIPFLVK